MMKKLMTILLCVVLLLACSVASAEDRIGNVETGKNNVSRSYPGQVMMKNAYGEDIDITGLDKLFYLGGGKSTTASYPYDDYNRLELMRPATLGYLNALGAWVYQATNGERFLYVGCSTGGTHQSPQHNGGVAIDVTIVDSSINPFAAGADWLDPVEVEKGNAPPEFRHAFLETCVQLGGDNIVDHYTGYLYFDTSQSTGYKDGLKLDPKDMHVHIITGDYNGTLITSDILKGIYDIGVGITELMEKMIGYMAKAYEYLSKYAYGLFFWMAVIDLALMTMLEGFQINPFKLIVKMLKYGFFLFIIEWWPKLANDFFVSFASSVTDAMVQDGSAMANLTQPHLILQKGLAIISPGLDMISGNTYTAIGKFFFALIWICAVIALIALLAFAVYTAITYIEFYMAIALNIIFVPLGVFGFTKMYSSRPMTYVWKCTIKMVVLGFLTGIMGMILMQVDPTEILQRMGGTDRNPLSILADAALGWNAIKALPIYAEVALEVVAMMYFGVKTCGSLTSNLAGRLEW